MLLSEWLIQAQERLEAAGIESARLEAQVLAAHGMNRERAWVLTHSEAKADRRKLEPLLARREKREPLAYILGYREFYGRRFEVTPDVLIPRQETETLVDAVLKNIPDNPVIWLLDLGTGSGCVAITLALERPDFLVAAGDISPEALRIAKRNARTLGAKVRFFRSNILFSLPFPWFTCIVCNPPYVAIDAQLQPEVGIWEPKLALFAGEDGLDFYRELALQAKRPLIPQGLLILEVGDGQATSVSQIFADEGWDLIRTEKDLSGMERVLVLRRPDRMNGR